MQPLGRLSGVYIPNAALGRVKVNSPNLAFSPLSKHFLKAVALEIGKRRR